MKKILLLISMAMLIISAGCSAKSAQESFPTRPIEVIVPFGEGSASDTFARKFTEILSKNGDQPYQTVNKDGSGGLIGMMHAHKQPNDGYTILEITPSHVIADVLGKGKNVKLLEDFEPLAHIQSDIYVLSVNVKSPIESFEDLIERGKKGPITFAGVSPGGLDDLVISSFAQKADIQTTFIPYKSGAEVKAAALGGEVDIYLDKLVNVVNYIKAGKVKPIVVFSNDRITQLPELQDTPTAVEKGVDVTIGSWRGFVIKKDAPQEVKDYLITAMKEASETEEYKAFAADNLVNIGEEYLNPEEFKEKMLSEYEAFDEVSKAIGLK